MPCNQFDHGILSLLQHQDGHPAQTPTPLPIQNPALGSRIVSIGINMDISRRIISAVIKLHERSKSVASFVTVASAALEFAKPYMHAGEQWLDRWASVRPEAVNILEAQIVRRAISSR